MLTVAADGRLAGTYEFVDAEDFTPGTLLERTGASGLKRTFDWFDRYGTGTLIVTFDADLSRFSGKWGMNDGEPGAIWNGNRAECVAVIS